MENLYKILIVFNLFFCKIISCDEQVYYKTYYTNLPVDHFNFETNATFELRYLMNDTYWKPEKGSPIFFYAGNEGDITIFANNTGFMWEVAPEFNALVIFAEHRYYGNSMPFGNLSLSNPKYSGFLTSTQALMDYVDLIYSIKINNSLPITKNPVIVFGGSYGGMLAAWFRMKYPAVVAGALASSAPIWQFTGMTPCNAFNKVVTSVYKETSDQCMQNIKQSWKAINDITSTDAGKSWLSKTFKTCKQIQSNNDVALFKSYMEDVLTNIAMLNYPYSTNFINPLPGYPVKYICNFLKYKTNNSKELLQMMFKAVSQTFANSTGTTICLDIDAGGNGNLDTNAWNIQSCNEIVIPMCSDDSSMFEKSQWNFTEFSNTCFHNYQMRPKEYLIEKFYGGKDIHTASNIIFSNGLLDPWSSGGVLKNVSNSCVIEIIKDSAHHLDLRFSNPADPPDIRKARLLYKRIFKKWIKEFKAMTQ